MSYIKTILISLCLIHCSALHADWPQAASVNKPWTRWWWHGSAVTETELTRELESFARAGIGGVEITPIYGVIGNESNEKVFLSPEWLGLVRHTLTEAKRLGMQVDIVPGTGWRLGSESVPEGERAVRLKLEKQEVDGALRYTGSPELSGEKVKRGAPGGTGYTIDMLNHDAIDHYLEWFSEPFFSAIPHGLARAMFHDSWEYNTDWTHDFAEQFRKRRGFDAEEILPIFDPENSSYQADTVERWRYAYRLTLEELLLENFCGAWNDAAHRNGMISRNQGHGSIANLLDVYAMADIPETEIFRDHETFIVHKFASSAAHVSGKQLVSSESYTWMSEHWKSDLAKLKHFTDYLFLCGINHIFFHGTAYSPDDAPWPGWVFYASTQLNDRNPVWHHLPVLNDYIARCQVLLQSGKPYTEAYLYWPIADLYAEKPGSKLRLHISGEHWLEGSSLEAVAVDLWEMGVHFDYVSDRQLQRLAASGDELPTIILPPMKRMPLATMEALDKLARQGVKILSLDDTPDWRVPDAVNVKELQSRLAGLLKSAREHKLIQFSRNAITGMDAADTWQAGSGIRCIRRIMDDGSDLYFITNRGAEPSTVSIPVAAMGSVCQLMHPWTGEIETVAPGNGGLLEISLDPDESVFIRPGGVPDGARTASTPVKCDETDLSGGWLLSFVSGGPMLREPLHLENLDWITHLGFSELESFAGLLRYENRFHVRDEQQMKNLSIDLGELSSSAQVFINGSLAGTSIRAPHILSIPAKLLKTGDNSISVEIATLADNRIRYMDRTGIPWRIFKDINFVSLEYGGFDASRWAVSDYGLKGPVKLLLPADD